VRTSRDWIGERRLCAAPDGSIEADCSGPSPRSVPESQDPPAVPPTAAGSSGGFGQARDSAAEEARERGECCLEAVETGEAARNVPLGVAVACGVFADAQHRADGVPRHTPVAGSSDDGRRQAVELLVQLGNPLQGFFSVKGRQKPREVACTVLYVLGDLDEEFVPGRRAVSARWGRGAGPGRRPRFGRVPCLGGVRCSERSRGVIVQAASVGGLAAGIPAVLPWPALPWSFGEGGAAELACVAHSSSIP
jgi:hypothetical protein